MSKNKGNVRPTLINLWKRTISVLKGKGENIYLNGDNNLYPNEIEAVISNSPTASRCASVMAKYISGEGVYIDNENVVLEYEDLPIVNKKKNYKITDIIEMASRSIAKQKGVWFHVGYGLDENADIISVSIDVLDYLKPRLSKEDTEDNMGKIYIKDWDEKTAFANQKIDKWFYPFNSNKDVILAQIQADNDGDISDLTEAIQNYRGQVYYLNLTPEYVYAESPIHAAYNDADTENRISIYTNKQTRDGFLGKTIVLTQGLDEEQEEQINEDLKSFLGAENSSQVMKFNVEQADNLENFLKVIQLEAQFDDKLFEVTDKRILRNLFGAFNNIPPALVISSDGALFSTSGETYREMKEFYSEQTREEREKLERALYHIGFPIKIKPIGYEITKQPE